MGIIPSGLKKEIHKKFTQIKNEVGKSILIYTEPLKEDCPNCLGDHTGASTNQFDSSFVAPVEIFGEIITPQSFSRIRCPVCHGVGYLESEVSTYVKAIVRWNPPSEMVGGVLEPTPAGVEGKNAVRIKTDRCYYNIIRDSVKAVIDGVDCVLYLPPSIRRVGSEDIMVVAYFVSSDVGHSTRE